MSSDSDFSDFDPEENFDPEEDFSEHSDSEDYPSITEIDLETFVEQFLPRRPKTTETGLINLQGLKDSQWRTQSGMSVLAFMYKSLDSPLYEQFRNVLDVCIKKPSGKVQELGTQADNINFVLGTDISELVGGRIKKRFDLMDWKLNQEASDKFKKQIEETEAKEIAIRMINGLELPWKQAEKEKIKTSRTINAMNEKTLSGVRRTITKAVLRGEVPLSRAKILSLVFVLEKEGATLEETKKVTDAYEKRRTKTNQNLPVTEKINILEDLVLKDADTKKLNKSIKDRISQAFESVRNEKQLTDVDGFYSIKDSHLAYTTWFYLSQLRLGRDNGWSKSNIATVGESIWGEILRPDQWISGAIIKKTNKKSKNQIGTLRLRLS